MNESNPLSTPPEQGPQFEYHTLRVAMNCACNTSRHVTKDLADEGVLSLNNKVDCNGRLEYDGTALPTAILPTLLIVPSPTLPVWLSPLTALV